MGSEDDRTLWCGNLSDDITEELLYELFLQAGPLESVRIPKDNNTGRKKNFSFIKFKHVKSVPYTIDLMNGIRLAGRSLRLQSRPGSVHQQRNTPLDSSPMGAPITGSGFQRTMSTSSSGSVGPPDLHSQPYRSPGMNRQDSFSFGRQGSYGERESHVRSRSHDRGRDRSPLGDRSKVSDRSYDERSRGGDRNRDDRSRGGDRSYDDRQRGGDRNYDDKSRGGNRSYDDRSRDRSHDQGNRLDQSAPSSMEYQRQMLAAQQYALQQMAMINNNRMQFMQQQLPGTRQPWMGQGGRQPF